MTAANVLTFYAQARWGSRYGVEDAFHPTPHKGLDCGLFHGTVQVPALYAGTVVAVHSSTSVGHYVTVRRATFAPLFDTYCHIVPGVSIGEKVTQGTSLGRQAVTLAEGGTAWRGQHTHLCLSNTIAGWAEWDNGLHNLDPTPGVIAVLTGTAGAGSSPLEEEEMSTATPIIFDGGPVTFPGFGSTGHMLSTGIFLPGSDGLGPRDQYGANQAYLATLPGVTLLPEVHKDANVLAWYKSSMLPYVQPGSGGGSSSPAPTVPQIAAGLKPQFDALGAKDDALDAKVSAIPTKFTLTTD
jgi:hypothetical protein